MDLLDKQRAWQERQEAIADARHRQNQLIALLAACIGVIGTLLAAWLAKAIGAN